MIGTDCTGSCKYNYHTMRTATVPMFSIETNLFYTVNSFVFIFFFVFFGGGGGYISWISGIISNYKIKNIANIGQHLT